MVDGINNFKINEQSKQNSNHNILNATIITAAGAGTGALIANPRKAIVNAANDYFEKAASKINPENCTIPSIKKEHLQEIKTTLTEKAKEIVGLKNNLGKTTTEVIEQVKKIVDTKEIHNCINTTGLDNLYKNGQDETKAAINKTIDLKFFDKFGENLNKVVDKAKNIRIKYVAVGAALALTTYMGISLLTSKKKQD